MHARSIVVGGVIAALGLVAAGCGGTTSPPATTRTTPTSAAPATTLAPVTKAQTTAAVTATWTKFFDYSTPEAARLALLQDGTKYSSVVSSLTPLLPTGAMATVQSVKSTGTTTAAVTYSLEAGGSTVKSGLTGMAVEVGGKWLVSSTTFCGLLALAGTTCPS